MKEKSIPGIFLFSLKATAVLAVWVWPISVVFIAYFGNAAEVMDEWVSFMLPGLRPLTVNALNPLFWRVYFVFSTTVYLLVVFALLPRIFEIIRTHGGELFLGVGKRAYLRKQFKLVATSLICLIISTWIYLFSKKPWVSDGLNRGTMIIHVYHSSHVGLILWSWVSFILINFSVTALMISLYSFFYALKLKE